MNLKYMVEYKMPKSWWDKGNELIVSDIKSIIFHIGSFPKGPDHEV
jgi:hypothetical protein